jgi:hypothetical protein
VSRLIFNQLSTTPSDTDAGSSQLYLKDDGKLYIKNASNTEVALLTGTGAMPTVASGKVGIGTTSPAEILTLDSPSNTRLLLRESGANKGQIAAGGSGLYFQNLAGDIHFRNIADSQTIIVKDSGKVGIGTITPSEQLSVAGAVSATNVCKAWFNWSDGAGDFERSYNMSSETDNGTGDYSFAFTTPMDNANFCVVMGSSRNGGESSSTTDANTLDFSNATVNGFKIRTSNGGAYVNHENVCAAIFDTA